MLPPRTIVPYRVTGASGDALCDEPVRASLSISPTPCGARLLEVSRWGKAYDMQESSPGVGRLTGRARREKESGRNEGRAQAEGRKETQRVRERLRIGSRVRALRPPAPTSTLGLPLKAHVLRTGQARLHRCARAVSVPLPFVGGGDNQAILTIAAEHWGQGSTAAAVVVGLSVAPRPCRRRQHLSCKISRSCWRSCREREREREREKKKKKTYLGIYKKKKHTQKKKKKKTLTNTHTYVCVSLCV